MRTKVNLPFWWIGLIALVLTLPVRGYDLIRNSGGQPLTWDAGSITMQIKLGSDPALIDGTNYSSSVQAAMQAWNANIVNVQFVPQIVSAGTATDQNGVNEIAFGSSVYGQAFDENVLAVTVYYYTARGDGSSRSTQADIIFNSAFNWNSYRGWLQAPQDIRRVALHELGHVLGLDHPDQASPPQYVYAVMNSSESNVDSLQADDIAGARSLYGAPPAAPVITGQPANQYVYAEQTAQFSVVASGNPNPTFKWMRLPAGSGSWSDLSEGERFGGTTTSNLIVAAAQNMNGDQFACVVSNASGSVTSSPAVLTVTVALAPVISNLPSEIFLSYGDTLTMSATVTGTQPITYQWKKDGAIVSDAVSSSYTKANISASDNGQYTLTASNFVGTITSSAVAVTARAPRNIVRLIADPFRSRVYALEQNGINAGSLLVIDPTTALPTATISVGQKPTDFSISADGNELLVICSASQSISVINLQSLVVTTTIPLTNYGNWDVTATSAHIKHGSGTIIYYSDGNWAPVMRVFDRNSQTVLQSIMLDGSAPNNNGSFGFGDFVLTPDKSTLFAWGQYGWSAGSLASAVAKFHVNADGTLTLIQTGNYSYPGFVRDPLETPGLMTTDGAAVFIKQYEFAVGSVTVPLQSFSSPVFAISPKGEIAATSNGIYQTSTGNLLYPLNSNGNVQAITPDYSRLVYFDRTNRQLRTVDLIQNIGPVLMGQTLTPANGSFVLAPSELKWIPQPGISRYRIYFGTSSEAVASATTASLEYLGEVSGTSISLASALVNGATYYWRVDAISSGGLNTGTVLHFTTATISSNQSQVAATTVTGDKSTSVDLALASTVAGKSWTASVSASWMTVENSAGTTPATLKVKFDTTALAAGSYSGMVTIAGADGSFAIPVQLRVDPLALTMIRAAPGSTKVYAISEEAAANYSGFSRAYLLEIDTLFKRIDRVVRVGTGVSDFTLHPVDGRIYVTNWRLGSILAIDRGTFSLSRTYAFALFNAGYGSNDAYRVSAGRSGRLVVEPEDQWIDVSLYDTAAGNSLATIFERAGGGAYDPAGRYYFHGDGDISNAALHKLDTQGDQFVEVAKVAVGGANYYGDRTIIVSENGRRIFWNGAVFNEDLSVEWVNKSTIYSASADGRYAFGSDKIYDVVTKQVVGNMPASTKVSAFNSVTGQLVVQNGTALQFYSLPNAVLPGVSTVPANGGIVLPPTTLQWTPLSGATGYRVYLGLSQSAVQSATTASPEYLGQVSGAQFTLSSALAAGHGYFWRVDVVVGGEVATGATQDFVVSQVVPSITSIDTATVKVDNRYPVDINLTSDIAGRTWSVAASAPWITLVNSSGTTPATLEVNLDITFAPVGFDQGTITVTTADGSFVIPVKLQVDPLALTMIRSEPGSTRVYAISEDGAANYSGLSRAYLLEIDTLSKRVDGVIRVGTGVTDFAIHPADRRIYVSNWKLGALLGINLDTFSVEIKYPFSPFNGSGYSSSDVFRVAAGGPGRLVVEPEDQWINLSLYDSVNSISLATTFQREGGGAFDPTGRFYYHGDNNSSGSALHKLDTLGDHFVETGSIRPSNVASYYGDRTVVVAENGHRVFWNGVVFDENLVPQWTVGSIIYSASADGRYAFGATTIYDVVQKRSLGNMPVSTSVSAFNSTTGRLVVQKGSALEFYVLPDSSLAAPASNKVLGDFDGNGKADLLWTNTQTGERSMWFLNGNTTSGGAILGTVQVDWTVGATADFDGDGKADIFWTNTVTGDRAIWLMNGSSRLTNTFMGTVPPEWVISGTGDFNGDGKADLVWTNTTTGDRAMWLMNGSTVLGGGYLGTVPVAWTIAGVGDFNGDGKADLVWSNTTTGERAMWFMNGSTQTAGATLGTVPTDWVIAGVGDFNGDGKADIFLTNMTTGDRVIWLMNGSTIVTNAFMGTIPVEWSVNGTGDFNGDGKKDLFWTNTTTGDRAMWLLNGSTVSGGGFMGTVPTIWKINQ